MNHHYWTAKDTDKFFATTCRTSFFSALRAAIKYANKRMKDAIVVIYSDLSSPKVYKKIDGKWKRK